MRCKYSAFCYYSGISGIKMKIQPKNIVITVFVIVITPFVWTVLFSNNGMHILQANAF